MPSRSDLEIKGRLVLGVGLLALVVVLLLRLLLPVFAIAGLAAGSYYLWQQNRKQKQHRQKQQARINAKFYQLLQQQQGRISVLDFAMRTQMNGTAAQAYLNTQAQAFSAFFETTPQGDIIYVFNLASVHHPQATQAEAAWAYAEQMHVRRAQAERAQAQQAHAAWSNAKQIRTLRQLSQSEDLTAKSVAQRTVSNPEPTDKPVIRLPEPKASSQPSKSDSSNGTITIDVTAVRG